MDHITASDDTEIVSNAFKTLQTIKEQKENEFNLQEYLSSNTGEEWLQKIQVKDSNNNSFRYYAPSCAWEDIHRHDNSSSGDFIFDVTMNIKDDPSNKNNIRYALRPQNMTDPISLQSTQEINIPIGNYNGNPLRNVPLIDLLSNENLLKQIGIDCTLDSSLYEPLIDEPAQYLPDIECICGQPLNKINELNSKIKCNVCSEVKNTVFYQCPLKQHEKHGNSKGYNICNSCVGLQLRSFIEPTDSNSNNNKMDTDDMKIQLKMDRNKNKTKTKSIINPFIFRIKISTIHAV
eukprot:41964_1